MRLWEALIPVQIRIDPHIPFFTFSEELSSAKHRYQLLVLHTGTLNFRTDLIVHTLVDDTDILPGHDGDALDLLQRKVDVRLLPFDGYPGSGHAERDVLLDHIGIVVLQTLEHLPTIGEDDFLRIGLVLIYLGIDTWAYYSSLTGKTEILQIINSFLTISALN